MNKNILLFLLLNWLWIFPITAQTINYTIVNNPPSQVAEWIKDPQPFSIQIMSPSNMTGIRVIAEVKKSGATVVTTNSSSVFPVNLNVGMNLFKGMDVWNPFCFNIDYDNVDVASGQLKAGDYEMCLWMLNDQFQQVGNISCQHFKVTQFSEPTLIFPQDEWTGTQAEASNIIFRWSSVIPNYPSVVNYTLEIFEATEGMSQLQALATPPIEQQVLTQQNIYVWLDASSKISQRINTTDTAYKYYWRVKAEDINTLYPIGCKDGLNKGYSEVQQFTVHVSQQEDTDHFKLDLILLKDTTEVDTTIAYKEPILTDPIHNDKLSAKPDDGIKFEWTEVTPKYPSPVIYKLEVFDLSKNKKDSNLVFVKELKNMTSFTWKSFKEKLEDQEFEWRVQSLDTLKKPIGSKNHKLKGFSQTESITINKSVLKEPELKTPKDKATLSKKSLEEGIELKWDAITTISTLKLKYKVEVYKKGKDEKNDSLITTQTIDSTTFLWKPTLSSKIQYKWHVQVQDSTGKPIGVKTGDEKGFSDDFTFTVDTAFVAEEDTVTDCDGKKTVVTNDGKENSVNAKDLKNKFLKINEFSMLVTEATGSSESLSGKGTIIVSWLKMPMAVEYNNISVDASTLKVTSGSIHVLRDEFGEDIPTFLGSAADDKAEAGPKPKLKIDTAAVQSVFRKLKKKKDTKLIKDQSLEENIEKSKSGFNVSLPLGLNDLFDYTIVISEMRFTPEKNTLVAVAVLPIIKKGGETTLAFAATDISFGASTPSKGGGKLALIKDCNIVDPDSNSYGIAFAAMEDEKPLTYIEWDCKGFKLLKATVDVSFPRKWLTPTAEDADSTKKVVGRASTEITNLKDWMLSLSLEGCSINGLEGVELEIKNMVFDHSDTRNPEDIEFPDNWKGSKEEDFQGFFLQSAGLVLPKFYNKSTDSSGIAIGIDNFIITKQGLSGTLKVGSEDNPIINLESGTIGDFQASIEKVEIDMLNMSVLKASVEGKMVLPISSSTPEKPNTLKYESIWTHSDEDNGAKIQLTITPENIETDIFDGATLSLLESSAIEMSYTWAKKKKEKGTTTMHVMLAGRLAIEKRIGNFVDATIDMDFENLGFKYDSGKKTKKFEFYSASFAFASPQKLLSGFPINFLHVEVVNDEEPESGYLASAGLKMQIDLNLTSTIKGSTKLKLIGGIKKEDLKYKPSFIKVQIDSIGIKAQLSAVDLEGSINFYRNDSVFGDGFRGVAKANFKKAGMLKASVLFGRTLKTESDSSFRYWYADALFILGKPLPMVGPLGFKGAGIAAWHNMSVDTSNHVNVDEVANAMGDKNAVSSGSVFIPDNTIKFGFRIMGVFVNVNSEKTFNGDVTFSAAFNTTGGINYLELGGKAFMGAEIKERSKAPFNVSLLARYDDTQGTFDLNVAMAIKYPATGKVVIKTTRDATLALNIKEKDTISGKVKWSLCIGTPEVPNQVEIMEVKTWAYFRTGNNLSSSYGFQPSTIVGIQSVAPSFKPAKAPLNDDITGGKGFEFGVGVNSSGEIDTKHLEGSYNLGAELNLSMIKYNSDHSCVTDKFNYWYATGGVAAWASAKMQHKKYDNVKCFLGLAGMIQGGAPEPLWVNGLFAAKVDLRISKWIRVKLDVDLPLTKGTICN